MNPFEFRPWYPKGVTYFIAAGASSYIAVVDKEAVLKFPLVPLKETDVYTSTGLQYRRNVREAAVKGLAVEEQILRTLGQHPRIVRLIRKHEDGLVLEYLPNGLVGLCLPWLQRQSLDWDQQYPRWHLSKVLRPAVEILNKLVKYQNTSVQASLHPRVLIA
ncbi:hypothetical protein BKA66DRAFT_609572 [Pyrenochaeta sp. MPI-SDFR-AT-0127]|nr:hypothetical protein BKA66DRAFT_609572 [Pyrenochaeta sp. MPI-SDFR-AT-0127]